MFLSSFIIQAEGTITFSSHDFAPFIVTGKDSPTGAFVDVIRAICKETKKTCSTIMVPNRRSKQMLKNGDVNGAYPLGWNKKRTKWLYFSVPLLTTQYGFFTQADRTLDFKDLSSIQGLSVGVFGPSNTLNTLEKIQKKMKEQGLNPIKIMVQANTKGSGVRKLSKKRFDLWFSNKQQAEYRIQEFKIKNIRYLSTHKSVEYYAAFAKAHNDLNFIKEFNRTAIKLVKDGTIKSILDKYDMIASDLNEDLMNKVKPPL
jgi:polar amino acid transport system substrate-binding protein